MIMRKVRFNVVMYEHTCRGIRQGARADKVFPGTRKGRQSADKYAKKKMEKLNSQLQRSHPKVDNITYWVYTVKGSEVFVSFADTILDKGKLPRYQLDTFDLLD